MGLKNFLLPNLRCQIWVFAGHHICRQEKAAEAKRNVMENDALLIRNQGHEFGLGINNRTLSSAQRETAEMKFLLSCCYMEIFDALQISDEIVAEENRKTAQEILLQLVESNPNRSEYRFQLMQALAEVNVFKNRFPLEQLSETSQRLTKARNHGNILTITRPDIPKH